MAEEKPFLEFTIDNTWLGSMQTKAVLEGKAEIVCQAGPSSFDLWGPVEMVSAGLVNCILSIVGIYLEHRNMSTEGLHARIVTGYGRSSHAHQQIRHRHLYAAAGVQRA